ncbi:hypothetical protein PMI05_04588 [Brevibacillus sp. BC25]|nr:hypothetical protein PMI05_04588 [Brevibacillus sp. BC25]
MFCSSVDYYRCGVGGFGVGDGVGVGIVPPPGGIGIFPPPGSGLVGVVGVVGVVDVVDPVEGSDFGSGFPEPLLLLLLLFSNKIISFI